MGTLEKQGDQYIASKEPATPTPSKGDKGYGQNNFGGASSDLPGDKTTSGFLPQSAVPDSSWQTRQLDPNKPPVATAHGMRDPNRDNPTFPANRRPVTIRK